MQSRNTKQYVILNAALDNANWSDWMTRLFYRGAALFFKTKHHSTRIVDVYDKPTCSVLSQEDKTAIHSADKILILGHCYEDEYLWDGFGNHKISAVYIAELLADALNGVPEKPRQISIVACESLLFAATLLEAFSSYPNLIMIPITARKYEIFADPFTGRKFNNVPENGRDRLLHHSKTGVVYKTRFFTGPAGERGSAEIAGNILQSSHQPAEILSDIFCQIVNWTR